MEQKSTPAWLSLGANLGNPTESLAAALELLSRSPCIQILSTSRLYRTAPVGYTDQPPFINQVVKIETTLPPRNLHQRTLEIERTLGRQDRPQWHEREIDIDILMFGHLVIDEEGLRIPHPRMADRSFVLDPFAEIDPEAEHPVFGETILVLRERLVRDPGAWIVPIESVEEKET